ncbi:hypothetical protein [Mesorhizobium huakuii]|uniref:Uncharacterized protein n=1 Tax=Mesorhizobium huakuii TaxID=28104 RepID=A0A7G6T120_9HYPH|nr:hypothetical protein [Mesorhizobium huakuii]QND60452.1 hypothetical protein HB778_30820 [Mesorhizobium huakuii]
MARAISERARYDRPFAAPAKRNTFDLADGQPIAERRLRQYNLGGRITADTMDSFSDEFPKADIITMGTNLENKKMLIAKAYCVLPPRGALVAIEATVSVQTRDGSLPLSA